MTFDDFLAKAASDCINAAHGPQSEVCWMCGGTSLVEVSVCGHGAHRDTDPPCSEQCMKVEPCAKCGGKKRGDDTDGD